MVVYLLAQGNFYDSLILNMTYDSLLDWAMNRENVEFIHDCQLKIQYTFELASFSLQWFACQILHDLHLPGMLNVFARSHLPLSPTSRAIAATGMQGVMMLQTSSA